VLLADFLKSLRVILDADYLFLAIKGNGIDWSSKEILANQFLWVGERLSANELNLAGKIAQQVYSTGKEFMSGELSIEEVPNLFIGTLMGNPLSVDDQSPPIGVVGAGNKDKQAFSEEQQFLFRTMVGHIALLVENVQGSMDLQYRAMIEERGRLAREIHDGLAQTLSFLKMQIAQMQSSLEKKDITRVQYLLKMSYSALSEAYQDVREAIDGLRLIGIRANDELPLRLDEAIQQVVQEYRGNNMLSSVTVNLQCHEDIVDLAPEVIAQVMRIIQEALSNIRKHSAADEVWIKTRSDIKEIILEIKDNGRGFAAEDVPEVSKHGLVGMRERAELIGADFQVISRPGEGTAVVIRLPILERRKMEL
jgi:two-component system nitrate/nitrite sensor histidine kinase NarX